MNVSKLYPLLMEMSLQVWLIASVLADSSITISMLYHVSPCTLIRELEDPSSDRPLFMRSLKNDALVEVAFSVTMPYRESCD